MWGFKRFESVRGIESPGQEKVVLNECFEKIGKYKEVLEGEKEIEVSWLLGGRERPREKDKERERQREIIS